MNKLFQQPKKRSEIRLLFGNCYYALKRKLLWLKMKNQFARTVCNEPLEFSCFCHKTLLLRSLKDVDMYLQYNKITNLKIAAKKLNGIIVRPGEIFSYWYLLGKPTKAKGYLDGMVLKNGAFFAGTGGGLCQMSNLIFWMALHTPLSLLERHRHGYDVFPDSNRTQPFGSGATCFYPHGDLMLKNETPYTFQLLVAVGEEYLRGEWRIAEKPDYTYRIVEKNHLIQKEYWGGYTRRNELYKQTINKSGEVASEAIVVKNAAVMMYNPMLDK